MKGKFAIYVMAVPVGNSSYTLFYRRGNRLFQPLGLLPLRQSFNASIELADPHWILHVASLGAHKRCQGSNQAYARETF
jgi:hypothetical protein